jgi:hypothetical protein
MKDTTDARKEGTERRTETEKLKVLYRHVGGSLYAENENVGGKFVQIADDMMSGWIETDTVLDAITASNTFLESVDGLLRNFSDFSEREVDVLWFHARLGGYVANLLRSRHNDRRIGKTDIATAREALRDLDNALDQLESEE